jgi:hypothetical protein
MFGDIGMRGKIVVVNTNKDKATNFYDLIL